MELNGQSVEIESLGKSLDVSRPTPEHWALRVLQALERLYPTPD
jgi:hypothetical protein